MIKSRKKKTIISILIFALILIILWSTGLIGLWKNGISYIANNTKKLSDLQSHIIEGNYFVSIDLSNLESNLYENIWSKQ